MITACRLQSFRVRTASGKMLGHVHDLRCENRGKGGVITHLVYGRRGLLERVGFRERLDTLPWSAVREIRHDELIVADPGDSMQVEA
jgi:hypothetical protein